MKRGFCGIGIVYPDKECNIGTLYRSAYSLGADYIFTVGRKYKKQPSDTCNATLHLPYYNYLTPEAMFENLPRFTRVICVENVDKTHSLENFVHPEQAIYLLGSESQGLPKRILKDRIVVEIPAKFCLNVSSAGSIILWDRMLKQERNICPPI